MGKAIGFGLIPSIISCTLVTLFVPVGTKGTVAMGLFVGAMTLVAVWIGYVCGRDETWKQMDSNVKRE